MTDPLDNLFAAVLAHRDFEPSASRTAKLWRDGVPKMAKKVAEEAVEVAIEAVSGSRQTLIEESADLLYNLAVLWAASGLTPQDIYDEMTRREQLYGIAQKLAKPGMAPSGLKVVPAVA